MDKNVKNNTKIPSAPEVGRLSFTEDSYDLWYGPDRVLHNSELGWSTSMRRRLPILPVYYIDVSRLGSQRYQHCNYPCLAVTLILEGQIEYSEDQRSVVVGPGEVMLQLPGSSDCMVNADRDGSAKLVAIFCGTALENFAQSFGFYNSGKIALKDPAPVEAKLRRIGALIEASVPGTEFELSEVGYSLWLELKRQQRDPAMPQDLVMAMEKLQQKKFILGPNETLPSLLGLSKSTVLRLFRRHFGCSPHTFLLRERLNNAAVLLRSGSSIKEAANRCGFSDTGYFSRCFRKQFHSPPGAFRNTDG